jgi:hypothetical protein
MESWKIVLEVLLWRNLRIWKFENLRIWKWENDKMNFKRF